MCDNPAPITKAKTVSKTDIMLWNAFNDNDFSDKQSLNKNANVLLHELTHIWQLQNNDRFTDKSAKIETVNDKKNPYQYRLNKRSKFEEFGIEQQASLIAHYYLLFFSADAQAYRTDYLYAAEDLKNVVEKRFPNARKTRIHYKTFKLLPSKPSH